MPLAVHGFERRRARVTEVGGGVDDVHLDPARRGGIEGGGDDARRGAVRRGGEQGEAGSAIERIDPAFVRQEAALAVHAG